MLQDPSCPGSKHMELAIFSSTPYYFKLVELQSGPKVLNSSACSILALDKNKAVICICPQSLETQTRTSKVVWILHIRVAQYYPSDADSRLNPKPLVAELYCSADISTQTLRPCPSPPAEALPYVCFFNKERNIQLHRYIQQVLDIS